MGAAFLGTDRRHENNCKQIAQSYRNVPVKKQQRREEEKGGNSKHILKEVFFKKGWTSPSLLWGSPIFDVGDLCRSKLSIMLPYSLTHPTQEYQKSCPAQTCAKQFFPTSSSEDPQRSITNQRTSWEKDRTSLPPSFCFHGVQHISANRRPGSAYLAGVLPALLREGAQHVPRQPLDILGAQLPAEKSHFRFPEHATWFLLSTCRHAEKGGEGVRDKAHAFASLCDVWRRLWVQTVYTKNPPSGPGPNLGTEMLFSLAQCFCGHLPLLDLLA